MVLVRIFKKYCHEFIKSVHSRGGSQLALVVKNLPANVGDARDAGWIPELGRSSGEGNGNLLQYSCLENPMARGASGLQFVGLQKSRTLMSN